MPDAPPTRPRPDLGATVTACIVAILFGAFGAFGLALSGIVWRPWEFGTTYHWNNGNAVVTVPFAIGSSVIAAILLVLAWVLGSRRWAERSSGAKDAVVVAPLVSVILIVVAWSLILSPGGSDPTWGGF
ncbi:hypothetical protein [Microbacterium gorillae]|uniref:hypothetical protein n=1 Tax=Microbacterium gorillae TaxID=1231063 RepID=UPI001142FDC0|nr:hypothetical protein [Microbacterium gorillae]